MIMEPRKQKSQTLPPGISPGKVSPTSSGGLFRRLKRRFRLRSKGYEFGIPEDDSVQGVSFRRRSDEYSSKSEKDKQNEIPRTQSDRRAEKPMLTILQGNKKKRNKKTTQLVNGNGIYEFDKSMERSFEERDIVENNFLVTDDQVVDLDDPEEKNDEIFIDPDPGYETLEEVRRKMKLNQLALNEVSSDQNFDRDANLRVSLHRRTQSSGTAESCMRSHDLDPNIDIDIGIGSLKIDNSSESMQILGRDNNLSTSLHRPHTICGNSPNFSQIMNHSMKNESSSLQDCNQTILSHEGYCNSDTCLCKYGAGGDLYANPKILFRKRSQKKDDSELTFSFLQQSEDSNQLNSEINNHGNPSPDEEGPPLPDRKYSMYDKTPDSIKSPCNQDHHQEIVFNYKECHDITESPKKGTSLIENSIQEQRIDENKINLLTKNNKEHKYEITEENGQSLLNTKKGTSIIENSIQEQRIDENKINLLTKNNKEHRNEITEENGQPLLNTSAENSGIHGCDDDEKIQNHRLCNFTNKDKTNTSISEIESVYEHTDFSKSEIESTANISENCGSLSVSISSSDTVKCIVLDSPLSTEGESIPDELETLHISEEDDGYTDLKEVNIHRKEYSCKSEESDKGNLEEDEILNKGDNPINLENDIHNEGDNSTNLENDILYKVDNSSNLENDILNKVDNSTNLENDADFLEENIKGMICEEGESIARTLSCVPAIEENCSIELNKGGNFFAHEKEVQLGWISEGLENTTVYSENTNKGQCSTKLTTQLIDSAINSACNCVRCATCITEINNSAGEFVESCASCQQNRVGCSISGHHSSPVGPSHCISGSKSLDLEKISLNKNNFNHCDWETKGNFTLAEGSVGFTAEARQNVDVSLDLSENYNYFDESQNRASRSNVLPTPETSQTQYFSDSRYDFRGFGNRHRKSSTMDSVSSFAESDDNSSIRSSEVLTDIHVMSYEEDADAILESMASRRSSFADELDDDSNGVCEAAAQETNSKNSNSQNQTTHLKRLPDFYYDDSEPIHMSLAELGMTDQSHIDSSHGNTTSCDGPRVPLRQKSVDIDSRPPAIVPRIHRETAYRQDFMESMQQLKDCGWYWGPLSWEEAEIKLLNKPDGSFLVRDSSDDRYILSLSFNMQDRVHHTRIEHHKGKFSFWSQPDTHGKSTIRQFIEQCVQNSRNGQFLYFVRPSGPGAPPMPVHLLHPVSRFKQMQSLQHSCRFKILQIVRRDHIDYLPLPTFIKSYLKEAQYYVEFLEE